MEAGFGVLISFWLTIATYLLIGCNIRTCKNNFVFAED